MDPVIGMKAIAAAIAIFSSGCSSIGEGLLVSKAIDGMSRNPEMYSKLRSSMIKTMAAEIKNSHNSQLEAQIVENVEKYYFVDNLWTIKNIL